MKSNEIPTSRIAFKNKAPEFYEIAARSNYFPSVTVNYSISNCEVVSDAGSRFIMIFKIDGINCFFS